MKRRIFAFVTMVVTLVLSVLFLAQPIKNMVNLSNDFGQGITLVYDITKELMSPLMTLLVLKLLKILPILTLTIWSWKDSMLRVLEVQKSL